MTTITQHSQQVQKMIRSVKRNLTKNERLDVIEHGIDGGFSPYIWHTDTMSFYTKHKEAIWELLEEVADGYGEPPLTILTYFKPGGDPDTLTSFENKLCWWGVTRCCEILEEPEDEED